VIRSKVPITSSVVTGRPLENAAPSRIVSVYSVGETCSQLSARPGWSAMSSSVVSSVS
jgi:hypothetical protein